MSAPPYQVIGLIGHPVAHSRSPVMQQAALDALGIPARYELWDTPPRKLKARVAALREPGVLGANVTIPYKTDVLPLLEVVTPEALRHAGAINTIVREEIGGRVRLVGHNTDLVAILRVLDEQDAWSGPRRMLVVGAGGAAQAALGAAAQRGAEPWLAVRHPKRGRAALAALWARQQGDGATPPMPSSWAERVIALEDHARLAAALAETGVLVNATPVGMGDAQRSPFPLALLRSLPREAFVFDMVYTPPETALVRAARAAGLRATGGLLMLLYQGAAAFTLWTQRDAPLAAMRAALGL